MKRFILFIALACSLFASTPIQLTLSDEQTKALQAIIDRETARIRAADPTPKVPYVPPTVTEYFTQRCVDVANSYAVQDKAKTVEDAKASITELDPVALADVLAYIETKKTPKGLIGPKKNTAKP